VHYDHYDLSKYMSNEGMIEFLRERHGPTRPRFITTSRGEANSGANRVTLRTGTYRDIPNNANEPS
jgi:hypothetical protein